MTIRIVVGGTFDPYARTTAPNFRFASPSHLATQVSIPLDVAFPPERDGPDSVSGLGTAVAERLERHPAFKAAMAYAHSASPRKPIPIVIEVGVAEGEAFPWEALYDSDEFFALDDRWRLFRIPHVAETSAALRRRLQPPVKIAAVLAARGVPAEPELDGILRALDSAAVATELQVWCAERHLAQVLDGRSNAQAQLVPTDLDEFRAQLSAYKPDVLHLFCHGRGDTPHLSVATGLSFEDSSQPDHIIGFRELETLVDDVWVISLNACGSAELPVGAPLAGGSLASRLVKRGAPAVVGMRTAIVPETAHRFVESFLRELMGEVQEALRSGHDQVQVAWSRLLRAPRQALARQDGAPLRLSARAQHAWTRPALYARPERFVWQVDRGGDPDGGEKLERVLAELSTLIELEQELLAQTPAEILAAIRARIEELKMTIAPRPVTL